MAKFFFTENGSLIIDAGPRQPMIIIETNAVSKIIESRINPQYNLSKGHPCGQWTEFTTRSGRAAVRVTEGNSHIFTFGGGWGNRSWNDWDNRHPVGEGVFAAAWATSNGGGVWDEVTIVPAAGGWKRADQARAEEELL